MNVGVAGRGGRGDGGGGGEGSSSVGDGDSDGDGVTEGGLGGVGDGGGGDVALHAASAPGIWLLRLRVQYAFPPTYRKVLAERVSSA